MEKNQFYEIEELEEDLKNIKQEMELLKGYDKLIKKMKEIKEMENKR